MCRDPGQDATGLEQAAMEWSRNNTTTRTNQRRLEDKRCSKKASSTGSEVRWKEPQRNCSRPGMPFVGKESLLYFFLF